MKYSLILKFVFILLSALMTQCFAVEAAPAITEPNKAPAIGIVPQTNFAKAGRIERDIVYGKAGEVELKLDLYLPADPNVKNPPLLVFVHGGAWQMGHRTVFMLPVMPELLKRGYAVASIGYRLAPQYQFPAQIEDIKCAVKFLRASAGKYGYKADRIGAWGESAGGHLVSLLGLAGNDAGFEGKCQWSGQSADIQAVVDLFGPVNIPKLGAVDINRKVFGAESFDDPVLKRASPVTYASKGAPPFLIIHGEQDRLVPYLQSVELHEKLKAAGADSTLLIVKDWGHGFAPMGVKPQPDHDEICRMIADFFDKHVRKP